MHLTFWPVSGLAFAAGLEIVFAVLTATRLRLFAAKPCALGLALASLWCGLYALDLSTADFATKLLLLRLRFLFIPFYSLVWFEAAYRFIHQRRCLFGWRLALASVEPAITVVLAWWPRPVEFLAFFRDLHVAGGSPAVLRFSFGPWGIVFFGYTYAFAVAAFAILWASLRGSPRDRRMRWLLLAALLIGGGLNALFALRLSPTPGVNYAPIFVPLICGLVAYAMARGRMLHLGPAARSALIEELEDVLVVLDGAGRIVDLNRAAAEALGLRPEAAIGRAAAEALAPWTGVPAALDLPAGTRAEVIVGGVPHELRLMPVPDPAGAEPARILLLRNIVDRKRYEEQLHKAKDAAEAADRAKSEFLAMISHEIRTPMNAVIGVTRLMESTPVTEEQRQYLDLIREGGRGLLVVIDDVLNYTKIISGRLELEPAPCSTAGLATAACELLRSRAEAKGIPLQWSIEADVPAVILGDAARIGQILTNLVGNAVKFTEKGGVTLRIARAGRAAAPDAIAFIVADSGIGIAPEALVRIFEPFSQADNSISRRFGGTGLGLAISRKLCRLMGGDLTVASSPGAGSTFTATIRARASSLPHEAVRKASQLAATDRPLRLLVVEDNRLNQRVLGALLGKMGHDFQFAESGQAGLDLLAAHTFDAVLMDVEMPNMDGYETVRRLRRREAEGAVRHHVIALTAHAMGGIREQCLAAGMDDYLTKPVDPAGLEAALGRCPAR